MPTAIPTHKSSRRHRARWIVVIVAVSIILFLVAAGIVVGYARANEGKIYPGVSINGTDLSGLDRTVALAKLQDIEKHIQSAGFSFVYATTTVVVQPVSVTADPDLARPVITFDWNKTLDEAMAVGRSGGLAESLVVQLQSYLAGHSVRAVYALDRDELHRILKDNFLAFESPAANPTLAFSGPTIKVEPERPGVGFDYAFAINSFDTQAARLKFEPIRMTLVQQQPAVRASETAVSIKKIQDLGITGVALSAQDQSWDLPWTTLRSWLVFQRNTSTSAVELGLDKQSAQSYFQPIADTLHVEAKDARFTLQDNRVTEFVPSQTGIALNLEKTLNILVDLVNTTTPLTTASPRVDLPVEVEPPKLAMQDLNSLGIKELIGRGVSNFKGSPKNRRHNIATGATSLNGILIAPDEEFSLLHALGEIDGDHGYLQELVIKGDRTIPEYGGGLCQIGTTTFRAALHSGLPIVERRNHSYRVVYYEPAGMDATIYDPAPDFKFLNDTGHHILFVTRRDGDNLIFEFYGTSDGRKVTITPDPPTITNVVKPGEPKYIETEELPPGEKKQVEKPHPGADTYFKYIIEYPDGRKYEKEFTSHYIAWPEVWLVGKAASSTPEVAGAELTPGTEPIPAP